MKYWIRAKDRQVRGRVEMRTEDRLEEEEMKRGLKRLQSEG